MKCFQLHTLRSFHVNPNPVDVLEASYSRGGGMMAPWEENGQYLSRLWSNFQNSFLWWKLVKIVTYFYSISNFLSIIVWPLDVAKVTKVCRVNFFEQKIQNFQFWATNMLYTSNESWNYVEFKFIMKKIWFDSRKFKKIHFSDFCLKNEADQVSSRADFSKSYQQISKMALPGAGRSFNLKSHQRRTHYLHPIQNGSQSPEHGAIVPPPWLE